VFRVQGLVELSSGQSQLFSSWHFFLTLRLADCDWRAAASQLKPLRLPHAQPSMSTVFCGQVLTSTESATSGQSTGSQCLSALPGRLGRVKFVRCRVEENQLAHLLLSLCAASRMWAWVRHRSAVSFLIRNRLCIFPCPIEIQVPQSPFAWKCYYTSTTWWINTLCCNLHSSN